MAENSERIMTISCIYLLDNFGQLFYDNLRTFKQHSGLWKTTETVQNQVELKNELFWDGTMKNGVLCCAALIFLLYSIFYNPSDTFVPPVD